MEAVLVLFPKLAILKQLRNFGFTELGFPSHLKSLPNFTIPSLGMGTQIMTIICADGFAKKLPQIADWKATSQFLLCTLLPTKFCLHVCGIDKS
jgi:hypothetical protein